MASVHEVVRRVRHAPEDIFDLVADVRNYPAFLKWVKAMRVLEDNVIEGAGTLVAEATVGFKFVRERFSTRVDLEREHGAIDVSFVEGPFTALENRWRLTALADGSTRVAFWIRYQFRNPVLQSLVQANLGRAADTMIDAFDARAAALYPLIGAAQTTLAQLERDRPAG